MPAAKTSLWTQCLFAELQTNAMPGRMNAKDIHSFQASTYPRQPLEPDLTIPDVLRWLQQRAHAAPTRVLDWTLLGRLLQLPSEAHFLRTNPYIKKVLIRVPQPCPTPWCVLPHPTLAKCQRGVAPVKPWAFKMDSCHWRGAGPANLEGLNVQTNGRPSLTLSVPASLLMQHQHGKPGLQPMAAALTRATTWFASRTCRELSARGYANPDLQPQHSLDPGYSF